MQVEHVARVRLAARRAAQQEGELTVGLGLLGQVVVHHEGVLTVFHPVLANGTTGIRGEELKRSRVAGGRHDDDGVLEGTVVFEGLHGLGDRRVLLADSHIDALHTLTLLVQDRVDGDGGLTGLTVTDDEFALSTADRGHGVDGLDSRLQGLAHGLTTGDTRRLDFHTTADGALEFTLAVDGTTEGIHDATEEGVTDRNGQDLSGGLHDLLFFEAFHAAEDDGTDGVFIEVHGETEGAVLEFEQLVHLCGR